MQAEVIAIGDELTSGQRLDTNSRWISQQLGDLGISTVYHTTVGDDLAMNVQAFRVAASRADIVICTGGLGPTQDDLTRQALADAFDCPLELDADSLHMIEQMFARRQRSMPERNRIQAFFPKGTLVIDNPHGSAPGIDLQVAAGGRHSRFFALPGVPAEMQQMWLESVISRIESLMGDSRGRLHYHSLKVFGIGESDVEVRLPDLISRQREPVVGITVSRATITLRIMGRAKTTEEFQTLISPTVEQIHAALGDLVFGTGDDELQDVVLRLLRSRQQKMATMEIGAASWIGDWMLNVNAKEPYFAGSVAVPTLEMAHRWLAAGYSGTGDSDRFVDDDATWIDLARQIQRRFMCEVGLVTGVYPSHRQMVLAEGAFHPVFALVVGSEAHVYRQAMGGHPDVIGPRIGKTGLDLVRRGLAGLPLQC